MRVVPVAVAAGPDLEAVSAWARDSARITHAHELGGDTDAIASMAGGLCGAHLGEEAIPKAWLDALEDGAEIRALADALLERVGQPAGEALVPSRGGP